MTTQEGINNILDDECDWGGKYSGTAEQVMNELLGYLHSQGLRLPNGEALINENKANS